MSKSYLENEQKIRRSDFFPPALWPVYLKKARPLYDGEELYIRTTKTPDYETTFIDDSGVIK